MAVPTPFPEIEKLQLEVAAIRTQLDRMENLLLTVLHGHQTKSWYSIPEVARLFDRSQYTVRERWCKKKKIKAHKDSRTGRWQIPGHEVARMLRDGPPRASDSHEAPTETASAEAETSAPVAVALTNSSPASAPRRRGRLVLRRAPLAWPANSPADGSSRPQGAAGDGFAAGTRNGPSS